MKKYNIVDYRLETKQFLKENKISAIILVKKLGVSLTSAYNWIHGRQSPSRKNFQRLQELISVNKNIIESTSIPIPIPTPINTEIQELKTQNEILKKELWILEGSMRARMDGLEKNIQEKVNNIELNIAKIAQHLDEKKIPEIH
jgi:hypothetical protein